MGDATKIEWTDATWNPVVGCSKVSAGCKNCYAERLSHRNACASRAKKAKGENPGRLAYYEEIVTEEGRFNGEVKYVPEALDQPIRWKKPRRIFVNSMSDLFHPEVPLDVIDRVFGIMLAADHHVFQLLTKRPERMRDYLGEEDVFHRIIQAAESDGLFERLNDRLIGWPMRHVWFGVSVEDQETANSRIPFLIDTPASVRWVSYEPALGPFNPHPWICQHGGVDRPEQRFSSWCSPVFGGIDWIVAGGESGPGARPAHPEWFRSVRDQCADARVAFHMKQWGAWAPESEAAGNLSRETARTALYVALDGTTRPAATGSREDAVTVQRLGKKLAGRTLDGEIHDGYQESRA